MYKELRDSNPFTALKFVLIILVSIMYSSALYFIPVYSYKSESINSNGHSPSVWDCSICTYYCLVICGTIIVLADMHYFSVFSLKIFALHFIFNTITYLIYDALNTGYMVSGITYDSVGNLKFWATTACTCAVAIGSFMLYRKLQELLENSMVSNIRSKNYYNDYQMKKYKKHLEELSKYNRSIAKFKRVYKNEHFEADNFGDKKMKELVQNYKLVKIKSQQL